jgi:hypothetical protein
MKIRICSVCKKELELSSKYFYKNKREIGGFDYRCKECKSIHYVNNKEKYKQNSTDWQKSNKDKIKIISKKYRDSKDGIKKRKEYRKKEYDQKYGIDIEWTLLRNVRIRLRNALKNNFKTGKTLDLLGCSIEFYKQYLENQFDKNMNWENYGKDKYWEIDHIQPLSKGGSFYYTNTRPYPINENRSKGNRWDYKSI